jgi:hypothetical protein
MVIGMVAVLVFIAGSLAFVLNPALAENKAFILAVVLVVYWGATYQYGVLSLRCISSRALDHYPGYRVSAIRESGATRSDT